MQYCCFKSKSLSLKFTVYVIAPVAGFFAPWSIALTQARESIDNLNSSASDKLISQPDIDSGIYASADSNRSIEMIADSNNLPTFEGEIGHFDMSQSFTNFIFDHQREIVFLDVYYFPDNVRELTVTNDAFGVDYLHLWHECDDSLSPGETLSSLNCMGTSFSINRGNAPKDADFTFIRGTFRAQGYFVIQGCDGPYQGSMGCTLRPLNPEDI